MDNINGKNSKNNSPKDSPARGQHSPIGDIFLRKKTPKEGSRHSGSHSREKSPCGSSLSKKSIKTSPQISPMKKKLINDSIIGYEEKKVPDNMIISRNEGSFFSVKNDESLKEKSALSGRNEISINEDDEFLKNQNLSNSITYEIIAKNQEEEKKQG